MMNTLDHETQGNDECCQANSRWSRSVIGILLIAFGALFLARNLGYDFAFFELHNWWAYFIFIGAVNPLQRAIHGFQQEGRITTKVARELISVLAISAVALLFILDLRWDEWWPVFLIIGGLCMLTSQRRR